MAQLARINQLCRFKIRVPIAIGIVIFVAKTTITNLCSILAYHLCIIDLVPLYERVCCSYLKPHTAEPYGVGDVMHIVQKG